MDKLLSISRFISGRGVGCSAGLPNLVLGPDLERERPEVQQDVPGFVDFDATHFVPSRTVS